LSWDPQQSNKLDLETLLLKVLMSLIETAGKIRLTPEMGDNFYFQVRTLIADVRQLLDDSTIERLNEVIGEAREKWIQRGKEAEEEADLLSVAEAVQDRGTHTFFCAIHLLEVTMVQLQQKGVIRLQKKGGITGWGLVDETTGKVTVSLADVTFSPEDAEGE
jgi:hypothetical protein